MKVLVTGAGGFIGHHLVTYLKDRGYWVRGVDIKRPEFTDVDAAWFGGDRVPDGVSRLPGNTQLPRQPVAGAGRHNAERDLAEGERGSDLIDGPVAAPGHHQPRAARDGRPRQLARMPRPLGDEDFGRIAVAIDDRGRQLGAGARRIGTDAAGNRIDDDGD